MLAYLRSIKVLQSKFYLARGGVHCMIRADSWDEVTSCNVHLPWLPFFESFESVMTEADMSSPECIAFCNVGDAEVPKSFLEYLQLFIGKISIRSKNTALVAYSLRTVLMTCSADIVVQEGKMDTLWSAFCQYS